MADRLPGSWRADYHAHRSYEDQFSLGDQLWGLGIADRAVSQEVLRHDVVLTRADGARLYVIDRPWRQNQFIVAALEPDYLGYSSQSTVDLEGPKSIAVTSDPVRAACDIARRLLPRYQEATGQVEQWAREFLLFGLTPANASYLQVAFTWQDDGDLHARTDHLSAALLLRQYSFRYDREAAAFLLPDTLSEEQKSQLIQRTALDLGAIGISVSVARGTPRPVLSERRVATEAASLHDLNGHAARAESLYEIVALLREATDAKTGPLTAAESFIRTLGARATTLAPEPLRDEFTVAFTTIATRASRLIHDLTELALGAGETDAITQARGPHTWDQLLASDAASAAPPSAAVPAPTPAASAVGTPPAPRTR
ncbi:hypothetical protein ACFS5L_02245 [Streptomyces phyllanthi]|uniref:Uncharacterized protein n=1 Tax=Streptomyces phyllanthi TaxID=1803180 RepID=A0A5N8WAK1_9ACTN|nr:hypothetical protein [Streptomyces phyllanthi]MPY44491.1 hypothetical protein [Streptomyces phyllanthi]